MNRRTKLKIEIVFSAFVELAENAFLVFSNRAVNALRMKASISDPYYGCVG